MERFIHFENIAITGSSLRKSKTRKKGLFSVSYWQKKRRKRSPQPRTASGGIQSPRPRNGTEFF
ncbi:hypothetical protein BN961_01410 [Afipia felis]|uniref:Uncharacterized protein n=1 Tax=Afipia felis TaxID=1035 RepID=A0A090MP05_AFIFE|nr:hypothetical protein AfiDRAFT_2272 [Afipia sp. 1NLS2]CEG08002.1 hypothetical protein BN961_01410 [Afipia felis]